MEASPLFIFGCDRSGTSLLRLMLTQHPDLHIPQESGFLDTLRDRADTYGDFTQPHQRRFFIRNLQQNEALSETKAFPCWKGPSGLRARSPTADTALVVQLQRVNWVDSEFSPEPPSSLDAPDERTLVRT